MVVSIANSRVNGSAFSADTAIAEVLLIAQRTHGKNETAPTVTYINLDHRPASISEAGVVSKIISKLRPDWRATKC